MPPFPRIVALAFLSLPAIVAAQSVFDCVAPAAPPLTAPVVLGNGSAGSVTTASLQAALDSGGPIRLNIGTSTLVVTAELRITRETVLDANGATLSGGNARRVLRVGNPNNIASYTFSLLNATITGGSTPGASGAGLYKPSEGPWQAVTLRIHNSRFTANTAVQSEQDGGGGAIYVIGAQEIAIIGSTLDGNRGSNGGALYSLGSRRVNLFDSTLSGNVATGSGGNPGNGGNGGALGVDGENRFVNLCRTRLLNNSAGAYGAGLFTVAYDLTSFTRIHDSTVQGNNSTGTSSAHTGGAYIQGGPVSIRGSTFRDNQASGYGGLSLFDHGNVITSGDITNSTFTGNVARTGLGGAMNLQATGGLTLQNLTIANNSAPCNVCFAGGIANGSNPITLRNTLFFNNTGGNAFNPWTLLQPVSGSNNIQWPLVRPGSFGQQENPVTPGAIFADAQLLPIANNGGLTETLALSATSPAVDAGTSTNAPPVDQRGRPRVGAVDVGAYEYAGDGLFADGFE